MSGIFFDELPEDLQERLAARNPELAAYRASKAPQEPMRAAAPAANPYAAPNIPAPSEREWRAFDRAQVRYLEAIDAVNQAYTRRNNQLMVRSVETGRVVAALLALFILVVLALGAAGGTK